MYKGRGCGDLAVNIGSTNEKPFTNTISNQSFNCSKESVFRQFRTSYASHSWEALNNHMWPEEPIQERDGGGGQPPLKSEVRTQSSKVGRLWFWG